MKELNRRSERETRVNFNKREKEIKEVRKEERGGGSGIRKSIK